MTGPNHHEGQGRSPLFSYHSHQNLEKFLNEMHSGMGYLDRYDPTSGFAVIER